MLPSSVPFGRTARRLEWVHLPPAVRALVEGRLGARVVSAESQRAGYTPGFASVLTTDAGTRHFVKAASASAQRTFAAAYREEARVLGALPAGTPCAPLLWTHDDGGWVVLETAYVEGRLPERPWTTTDLDAALDALETAAAVLTPAPTGLGLPTLAEEYAELPALWAEARELPLPLLAEHGEEAAALAAGSAALTIGETLVHNDVRDDNALVGADGRVVFCDWNFPAVGAAWVDTVALLIGPRGDGVDVEAVLAARALTRDVPAASVDALLALLCGYFLRQSRQPRPSISPYLRDFQRWQGEVTWDWLCERRGWGPR